MNSDENLFSKLTNHFNIDLKLTNASRLEKILKGKKAKTMQRAYFIFWRRLKRGALKFNTNQFAKELDTSYFQAYNVCNEFSRMNVLRRTGTTSISWLIIQDSIKEEYLKLIEDGLR